MLDYCQSNKKTSMSCQSKPQCGWSSSLKKYTCGTSGGKDPGGKFPKSCASYLAPLDGGAKLDGPKIPDGPPPPKDGPKPPPKDGPKPSDGPVKPKQDGLPPLKDGLPPPKDGPKPPKDGPKPPADGPKPPADGPKPPKDGPKPPADGPKPPADGPKPPADGPKPPTDGPVTKDNLPPKEGTGPNPEGGAKKPGTEGGPCYGNGTCNTGLKCYSSVCVKVPVTEAGAQKDAGGGIVDEDDTGCECSTSTVSSVPSWPLLLLGLVLVRLRRRK
jgi:MYXO-CTERM domain-containing protein